MSLIEGGDNIRAGVHIGQIIIEGDANGRGVHVG